VTRPQSGTKCVACAIILMTHPNAAGMTVSVAKQI
jgi:hypothetical protein